MDLIESRVREYKNKGVDFYIPGLILITDGELNKNTEELSKAINRTVDMVNHNKLRVFSIGISSEADMNTLNRFSPEYPALRLQGLKLQEELQKISIRLTKKMDWSDL